MNRYRTLKISLYLSAIFLAGVVTGAFISLRVAWHMTDSETAITERWINELQSKLNLTPEQVGKIKPIVQDGVNSFKATLVKDALSELTDCNVRIATELTPEQKAKFVELDKSQHEVIRRKFDSESPQTH